MIANASLFVSQDSGWTGGRGGVGVVWSANEFKVLQLPTAYSGYDESNAKNRFCILQNVRITGNFTLIREFLLKKCSKLVQSSLPVCVY